MFKKCLQIYEMKDPLSKHHRRTTRGPEHQVQTFMAQEAERHQVFVDGIRQRKTTVCEYKNNKGVVYEEHTSHN